MSPTATNATPPCAEHSQRSASWVSKVFRGLLICEEKITVIRDADAVVVVADVVETAVVVVVADVVDDKVDGTYGDIQDKVQRVVINARE